MLLCAQVVVLICAAGAAAQINSLSKAGPKRNAVVPAYDVTKELKIRGTIQRIENIGTNGHPGTHILVETAKGVVDAHLGFRVASGAKCVGIAPGESVMVTGMMQTVGNENVLIARVVATADYISLLRNEHGDPVRGIPCGSAPAKTLQEGKLEYAFWGIGRALLGREGFAYQQEWIWAERGGLRGGDGWLQAGASLAQK
jgi:hypothetical protein